MTCLAHTNGMEIDIDILPSIRRNRERLMHDAEVIVLLDGAVPPVPAGAVRVAVRERVQVLNGSPVRDGYDRVTSTILGCSEAGGFPQEAPLLAVRLGFVEHVLEIVSHLPEPGCEEP